MVNITSVPVNSTRYQSAVSTTQSNGPSILRNGIVQYTSGQPLQNYWNSITNSAGAKVGTTPVPPPYLSPPTNSLYNVYIPNNLYVGGTIYGTVVAPSDEKLKEQVAPLEFDFTEKILLLQPKSYRYISDATQKIHYGLIAQEVEQVFPELIYEHIDPTTNESTKAVNYVEMIPILLLKINDLQKQIDHLSQTR
jgi:hypothetical protein